MPGYSVATTQVSVLLDDPEPAALTDEKLAEIQAEFDKLASSH
jgi:hypothetical protein